MNHRKGWTDMTIGQLIKGYRIKQGLTQLQLAIRIKRSPRCIIRYENGERTPTLAMISKIFNVPIEDVLSQEVKEKGGVYYE